MRITTCTSVPMYYSSKNIQLVTNNQSKVNFRGLNINEISARKRLEEFTRRGYNLIRNDVDIISPNGIAIKGCAFVKDNLNHEEAWRNSIQLIITDKDYKALGEINSYHLKISKSNDILSCSIRNFTNKYNLMKDFMEPEFEAHDNSEGKYKKVGTGLYDNLVKYIKENHPQYKTLYASIRSQESWNFHSKYGFTMDFAGKKHPDFDDYDTYSPSANYLFYNIK